MRTLTIFLISLFSLPLALNAQSVDEMLQKVSVAIEAGQNGQAVSYFRQTIPLNIDRTEMYYWTNVDKNSEISSKLATELALAYKKKRNYDKAYLFYKELLQKNPNNVDCLETCAEMQVCRGQEKDALRMYEKILQLDAAGKLLNTGAWFAAETDKSDTQEKQTLSAVTQKYSDETQYATGDYINVYHFLDTLEKVPNRGLQMKMGKDGCYQMNSNDDSRNFNILQLTDIHITGTEGSYKKDIQAIDTVYTMIQRTTPDFIVLTGDVIFGVDGYDANDGMRALNVVSKLMDTIGIPWTWTFGNHDHTFFDQFSSSTIAAMLAQSSTLRIYPKNETLSGYTNGIFKLCNKKGNLVMGLVMLDSGDRIFDENGGSLGYDYIRDDQVEWYAKQIGMLQGQYGADAKTLMFFHIPLQEYQTAWDTGTPVFGTKREAIDVSQMHSGIFSRALELKSTVAMFCGHDHVNDFGIYYEGIELVYGKSIDYIAYPGIENQKEQRGATLISVDSGSGYNITPLRFE